MNPEKFHDEDPTGFSPIARASNACGAFNPYVMSRIVGHRLGVRWELLKGFTDALYEVQYTHCEELPQDLSTEVFIAWSAASIAFETCGSPIEELFLAHVVTGAPDTFVWEEDGPGHWHYAGVAIKQQVQVERYRLDFAFLPGDGRKLAVELDGHDFHERTKHQAQRDKSRDRRLQELGWNVLRFTGSEIWTDPAAAASEVYRIATAERS